MYSGPSFFMNCSLNSRVAPITHPWIILLSEWGVEPAKRKSCHCCDCVTLSGKGEETTGWCSLITQAQEEPVVSPCCQQRVRKAWSMRRLDALLPDLDVEEAKQWRGPRWPPARKWAPQVYSHRKLGFADNVNELRSRFFPCTPCKSRVQMTFWLHLHRGACWVVKSVSGPLSPPWPQNCNSELVAGCWLGLWVCGTLLHSSRKLIHLPTA